MATKLLHIDIITTILAKLPVRSLLRFKSVSKTWFNLINNPYFFSYHNQVCRDDEAHRRLIFYVEDFMDNSIICSDWLILRFYTRDLQFKKTTNDFSIKILCGTEVIFSGFDYVCFVHNLSPTISVLNPSTLDDFVLPSYGEMSRDSSKYEFFGFAYLASTQEYMVLRCFDIKTEGHDRKSMGVEMFKFDGHTNLECPSSSWKMAKKTYPGFYESPISREGPFVDRSMHWLIYANRHVRIFSFDVDNEILHIFDLPTETSRRLLDPRKLVNFDGRLGLLKLEFEAENFIGISLWTLVEKRNSSWAKMHTIELDCLLLKRPEGALSSMGVSFWYMSEGEVMINIDKPKGNLVYLYNMEKKKLVQVEHQEPLFKNSQMGFLKESMFQGQSKGYHHHQRNNITIMMNPLPIYIDNWVGH